MTLFLIKKSFFDGWDNLVVLIGSNLMFFTVLAVGLWPTFRLFEAGSSLGFFSLILIIPVLGLAAGTASVLLSDVADYKRITWSDIPYSFRKSWKASLLISLLAAVFFGMSFFGMSYYARVQNTLGMGAMALLFWISASVYLILLWFSAVRNRLSGTFTISLKKAAMIMLDNIGLSLFFGLVIVPLNLLLWPITAFGAFGPGGIILFSECALRLLIFKYDWLELNPEANRKDIPWYELLIDERERVGKRSLKGMIFPWKE